MVDGSGDALVIKVTNNEKFPVHVCVMSYQADGSIVVLYPPKNVSIINDSVYAALMLLLQLFALIKI